MEIEGLNTAVAAAPMKSENRFPCLNYKLEFGDVLHGTAPDMYPDEEGEKVKSE